MFIYFVGLILASYVRSVWQKDDVLRKKFSSTEAVLAEMRTIRCIEYTGKMKVITPFVGSQVAWNENMHIEMIAAEWMYHPYHFEMYQS